MIVARDQSVESVESFMENEAQSQGKKEGCNLGSGSRLIQIYMFFNLQLSSGTFTVAPAQMRHTN